MDELEIGGVHREKIINPQVEKSIMVIVHRKKEQRYIS